MFLKQNIIFIRTRFLSVYYVTITEILCKERERERERERELHKGMERRRKHRIAGSSCFRQWSGHENAFAHKSFKESRNSLRGKAVSVWRSTDVRYSERKAYKRVVGKARRNSILFTVRPCQFPSVMFRRSG